MQNRIPPLVFLLFGFALLAAGASPDAYAKPGPRICGIVHPLDHVLHCRNEPEPPPPPDPSPGSPPPVTPSGTSAGSSPASSFTTAQSQGPSTARAPLPEIAPPTVPAGARFVPNLLMLRFRPGLSAAQRAAVLADAGVVVDHQIQQLGVFVVRTPPGRRDQALARLSASSSVAGVEKDAIVEKLDTSPNDPNWIDQWGLQRIGLPSVWEQTRGTGVVVAVLDTGVDASHPDLQGAALPGLDLTGSADGASDVDGHGTSVAGIIAARTNNRLGIAGICWSCSVLPVKVLDDEARGSMDDLAAGIVKAADFGVRVINMSLGGPVASETLDQAINYAVARDVILVAASGNNSSSTPFYPAADPSVLGVAATNEADKLYPWSDFGSWVRLAAPGCNPAPVSGGGYASFCGTSSATPVVSGLVALALSIRPDLTREQIGKALSTASTPAASVPQGRIDGPATLAAVAPGVDVGPKIPSIATSTFHATLTPTHTWRVHQRVLRAGAASGTLTFAKGAWLTLSLITSSNKVIASVSGHSPLKLSRKLAAGLYWFGVAGGKRIHARYTLAVTARP